MIEVIVLIVSVPFALALGGFVWFYRMVSQGMAEIEAAEEGPPLPQVSRPTRAASPARTAAPAASIPAE